VAAVALANTPRVRRLQKASRESREPTRVDRVDERMVTLFERVIALFSTTRCVSLNGLQTNVSQLSVSPQTGTIIKYSDTGVLRRNRPAARAARASPRWSDKLCASRYMTKAVLPSALHQPLIGLAKEWNISTGIAGLRSEVDVEIGPLDIKS
jgi:hypothetical protein